MTSLRKNTSTTNGITASSSTSNGKSASSSSSSSLISSNDKVHRSRIRTWLPRIMALSAVVLLLAVALTVLNSSQQDLSQQQEKQRQKEQEQQRQRIDADSAVTLATLTTPNNNNHLNNLNNKDNNNNLDNNNNRNNNVDIPQNKNPSQKKRLGSSSRKWGTANKASSTTTANQINMTAAHEKALAHLKQLGSLGVCEDASSSNQQQQQQSAQKDNNNVTFLDPPLATTHGWTDFLEGPGLDPRLIGEGKQYMAACKFNAQEEDGGRAKHFPHALQQLYRCVSWWQYHREVGSDPNRSKILPPMELYMIWPRSERLPHNAFVTGLMHAIRQVWNVRLVPLRGNAPVVRAKVDYTCDGDDGSGDNKAAAGATTAGGGAVSFHHQRKSSRGYQTRQPADLQKLRNDIVSTFYPDRMQVELLGRYPGTDGLKSVLDPILAAVGGDDTDDDDDDDAAQKNKQDDDETLLPHPRIPVVTILNRHDHSGRHILNHAKLKETLRRVVPRKIGRIRYVDSFDNSTFQEQVRVMAFTDILISPHGAQLSGMFLLPRCGSVLELFGRGYSCPSFYGSLAAASGLRYAHLYTGSAGNQTLEVRHWMRDLESRSVARFFSICAPIAAVVQHVKRELVLWHKRSQDPLQNCL